MGRPHFAIVAGVCASAASFFGKCISYVDDVDNIDSDVRESPSNTFVQSWLLKLICIALMLVANMLVWTFFVKSLHQQGGSVVATVTSTATNYCCSAAIGGIVFGERTTPLWWCGTVLVMVGLRFISIDANSSDASGHDTNSEDNQSRSKAKKANEK